jgi:hypothetical protein
LLTNTCTLLLLVYAITSKQGWTPIRAALVATTAGINTTAHAMKTYVANMLIERQKAVIAVVAVALVSGIMASVFYHYHLLYKVISSIFIKLHNGVVFYLETHTSLLSKQVCSHFIIL